MSELIELLSNRPDELLGGTKFKVDDALRIVKELFDPIAKNNSVLEEVYIDGLDASQVWGQAKLIIDGVNDNILGEVIPELREKIGDIEISGDEEVDSEEEEDEEDEVDEEEEEGSDLEIEAERDDFEELDGNDEEEEMQSALESAEEEEEEKEEKRVEAPKKVQAAPIKDAFGLNDEFFDIDEFNRKTLEQERAAENGHDPFENRSDDEDIDLFADLDDDEDDDEEEEMPVYNDFFDGPGDAESNVKGEDEVEDDDEEAQFNEDDYNDAIGSTMLDLFADEDEAAPKNGEELSTFQKQQLKIQNEISELEKEAVADKKWAMKGESKAKDRPTDALLEEELEFERTAKPVPVITKEVTESLEDMIRRRIKSEQFDDLPKRVVNDVTNFRKPRFELSEQKNSKSLAEMYEEEYNKTDSVSETMTEELKKSHDEITALYQSLTYKLDSLSSAHFIPKPHQKAIDIKVNTSTIQMEDAQPLALSSETTLAPQEVYSVKKGISADEVVLKSGIAISKEELSRDDKQRLRRSNKRKRSKQFQQQASGDNKKSKKNDVIDTLKKNSNLTVIGAKGEKRDVKGNLIKDKVKIASSNLKL